MTESKGVNIFLVSSFRGNERIMGIFKTQEDADKEKIRLESMAHEDGRYMIGYSRLYCDTPGYRWDGPTYFTKVVFD
jgi:hypothetical protein